ncbi:MULTISPECIES: DUF397 domain-containing protein [Nocardiopsis]|uniref:DUF397 domain-containing protein n=2 Tax=Nocardiopsis TaxID=2013 RepID=A0A1M6NND8_9ACTN|nr:MULTISPECIES: DUF397 domain-containing protein [Nocardiopsis]MDT0326968.1 DUF397 domain-containing protein [Nocardiopsis sp. DSM 44743]SHJ97082.1 protein of unknown function [Nocardiopsis flavescens]
MSSVPWHKSSYSGNTGECVEVSEGPETRVRDTQHRDLGLLSVSAAEWSALINAITK